MKITVVQGAFLPVPPLLGGAVEKVWYALGSEFARSGHSVTHLSRSYAGLPASESLNGVQHRRVGGFDSPASLVYLKWLDLIYSLRILKKLPPADILVTNTFWLPLLVRNQSRGRLYVHIARYPKGQMRFYSHASRLHTVSHPVAEAIKREAPRLAGKIKVIPYPLTDDQAEASTQGLNNKERQILFAGRIHPEKGVHLLLTAFAAHANGSFKDWRLLIVGSSEPRLGGGGERYLQSLKELARPIADRVDWIGPVFEPQRLSAIYRGASMFVYPSLGELGETFGLAPLEAMSHGCVPIVSALPCFREYIEDGVNGYVFNHKSADAEKLLREKLAELANNDGERLRVGRRAMLKSRDYALDRIAGLYLADFQSLYENQSG